MFENILYIDPGSLSALFAIILGGIAGFSMYIKTKWQSIKNRKISE